MLYHGSLISCKKHVHFIQYTYQYFEDVNYFSILRCCRKEGRGGRGAEKKKMRPEKNKLGSFYVMSTLFSTDELKKK